MNDVLTNPTETTPTPTNGVPLSAERLAALVTRAKAILAGELEPEPLLPPPGAAEFFRKEFEHHVPPPKPEVIRMFLDRWALETTYQGKPVLLTTTRLGTQTVLAVGDTEIFALLDALPNADRPKMMISDTLSW